MQVKKFEAPTLQEALDSVKRELGPEAIILQTKKYKRGFGLMSKASVEVTAAVSERSLQKKQVVETRLPETAQSAIKNLPANRQADVYDQYAEKHLERALSATKDQVELRRSAPPAQAQAKAPSNRPKTAVRYADIRDDGTVASREVAPAQKPVPASAPVGATAKVPVEDEVRQLRRIIEEMRGGSGAQSLAPSGTFSTPALQDAFEQLVISGVDKRFALNLIKQAGFELGPEKVKKAEDVLDQLATEIMQSTEVLSPLGGIEPNPANGPAVISLVGPTGVGKTTTIAKIANEAQKKRGLRVGLINLDYVKASAFDQLATFARILNVPFRSANSVDDLRAAIQDFQSLDLILIDTTGRSQRDPDALKEIQAMLTSVPEMQTMLVLSATTRDNELYDMAGRFSLFRPQGIIVSKLDETTLYGAVYNVSLKAKLPLLYFTTGQRVPEDIEEASRERVVSLLMEL